MHLFPGRLADTLHDQKLGLAYLGFRIFKWLFALVIVVLIGLAVVASNTYPDQSQYVPNPAKATTAQWSALAAAKDDWLNHLKDLGQTFLLAPLFPLLGAVIGYIFGREGAPTASASEPNTPPATDVTTT